MKKRKILKRKRRGYMDRKSEVRWPGLSSGEITALQNVSVFVICS